MKNGLNKRILEWNIIFPFHGNIFCFKSISFWTLCNFSLFPWGLSEIPMMILFCRNLFSFVLSNDKNHFFNDKENDETKTWWTQFALDYIQNMDLLIFKDKDQIMIQRMIKQKLRWTQFTQNTLVNMSISCSANEKHPETISVYFNTFDNT